MRRRWRYLVELLSRREPASGLAWVRIAIGLVLIYSLLSIRFAGLVDVLWVDDDHGGYRHFGGNWLIQKLGGPTWSVVNTVWGMTLVGVVAMTLGLGGRLVIFAVLQGYNALVTINGQASGGYDLMLTNALWLLCLGSCMETLSLRCRLATGRWTRDVDINAWPRYVLAFQLLLIYTATGLYKFSADWMPGGGYTALYNVFQDPTWRRFDMDFTAHVYWLTQIATAVTWHFETSAWLMLLVYYYRDTRDRPGRLRRLFNRWDLRVPFTVIGVSLHVGILITLNVGPFSWVSLAYYLCLWHPDELDRGLARLSRVAGRLRRASGVRS